MSVLQHEYEYSKKRFFKLEYIYSWACTQEFFRAQAWRTWRNQCLYLQFSHMLSKTDLPGEKKKNACALKASFSKKSYLTESHRMHFPGLQNPQWYRRRDNSRNTYFLHSPMRAERQQLQDQPLDGNTQITVSVISSGPHLSHKWSGCQRDVHLHIGLSWKKKKPDFSWMPVWLTGLPMMTFRLYGRC